MKEIKTLIAVPCKQTVPTKFMRSLEMLRRLPETYTSIMEATLVHDARNEFAGIAIMNEFDRVLWLDSDMTFESDLLVRMSSEMDQSEGRIRMLSGLCFLRVLPTRPVIWSGMEPGTDGMGHDIVHPIPYIDYPRDQLFEVGACGFGAVMTDVSLLKSVWDKHGPPFNFLYGLGEDLSFCWRVREMGEKIWCDSRLKVGHVGEMIFGEAMWDEQLRHE